MSQRRPTKNVEHTEVKETAWCRSTTTRPTSSATSAADKAALYRAVLDAFAAAKRQYRLQLRPDEVLAEAEWPAAPPAADEVGAVLAQLVDWGNLQSQPDIARVTTLADYYRARYLYRLSAGGEAVESALGTFAQWLARRAELQSVALEDIAQRLQALVALLDAGSDDVPKLHETLRDLVRVFESLADNAQAFMAGVARTLELQRADEAAVLAYKTRLIGYLERFIGDLVQRSETIGQLITAAEPAHRPGAAARCRTRSARRRTRRRRRRGGRRKGRRWRRGANAGAACAAGSCRRIKSPRAAAGRAAARPRPRRDPATAGGGRRRSTSAAAAAATARPTSACWRRGSPTAPVTTTRTGWRARPSR